jgi:muramoyltetrapeptide carboxypeptidase
MERRNFMRALGASAAASVAATRVRGVSARQADQLARPRALRAGDAVALVTPATEVPDPERLALAERTVRHLGLRVKRMKNVGRRFGTYAESVRARLDDLHEAFRDAEVRAVLAVRGGYGSPHLLDRVDYDLVRRHPKIFVGYSDITALHLAIHRHARLVTFHGPVALSRFTGYTLSHFRRALFETRPLGRLTNPPGDDELRPAHPLRTVRPGTARGALVGGNLSLVCATLGTPYEIDTRGRILFLEEIGEQPYQIDRMLTQLRLAGKLDAAAGVVWGECDDCGPRRFEPAAVLPFTLGEVIDNILGALKVPVLSGLTIGHTADQLTLPLGVSATLDAAAGVLEITEAAVA